MRILVTNDDGIDAPGIRALVARLVAAGLDPIVVAPDSDYSGAGASLLGRDTAHGLDAGIPYERRVLEEAPEVEAWAIGGPPARCALVAMRGGFGEVPDAVISGINFGINTGPSVLHSGTIGAALTGARFNVPSLAVSAQFDYANDLAPRFDTAADLAVQVFETMTQSAPALVNLNVPRLDAADVKGIRAAEPAAVAGYRSRLKSRDNGVLTFDFEITDEPLPVDSDTALVRDGWATITAFSTTLVTLPCEQLIAALGEAA